MSLTDTPTLPPKLSMDWASLFETISESCGDLSITFSFQLEWVFDFYDTPERNLR